MKFYIRIVLLAAFLTSLLSAHAQSPTITWDSTVKDLGDSNYEVVFTGKILPGWHTYDLHSDVSSTLVEFEPATGLTLDGDPYEINASKREYDDIFEVEMGTYFDEIILGQKVTLTGEGDVLKGNINWRSCEEENCNSPEDWGFEITIGDPEAARASVAAGDAADQPVSGDGAGESKTLWGLIIEAVLWGFAALLTPCVFPMVPMTVSFFMKGSGSPAAGRFKASMYGFFIVALYTLPIAAIILITRLVGGDAVTADIFNWLATHWLPNLIFFIVFMIFAASFFGAFEITLPSWMVNKSDRHADKGGLIGIFFMALTLVLVSFSCTGPIVGNVLIRSTAGEFWVPIVTMFAFSLAFALPFTIFAFFPSLLKDLPKSGGWLGSVKVVLGFIEVALGFKFLSMADQTYHWGLLDREVYLAIWIVVFTLLGFYLLGKIKFPHDDDDNKVGVTRFFMALISLAFAVYMVPGLWGAPLKAVSAFAPPMHTQDFNLYKNEVHAKFDDYDLGMEYARLNGKPVMLDFTGYGCVNCRKMEAAVWTDPKVSDLINNDYVLITLYVDNKTPLTEPVKIVENGKERTLRTVGDKWSYLQRVKFGANAQPFYVLLDNQGSPLNKSYAYDEDIPKYIEFLQTGLENYRKEK